MSLSRCVRCLGASPANYVGYVVELIVVCHRDPSPKPYLSVLPYTGLTGQDMISAIYAPRPFWGEAWRTSSLKRAPDRYLIASPCWATYFYLAKKKSVLYVHTRKETTMRVAGKSVYREGLAIISVHRTFPRRQAGQTRAGRVEGTGFNGVGLRTTMEEQVHHRSHQ